MKKAHGGILCRSFSPCAGLAVLSRQRMANKRSMPWSPSLAIMASSWNFSVGVAGFEPAASSSRTRFMRSNLF